MVFGGDWRKGVRVLNIFLEHLKPEKNLSVGYNSPVLAEEKLKTCTSKIATLHHKFPGDCINYAFFQKSA